MPTQPQDHSEQAVRQQREIQKEVAAAEKAAPEEKAFGAMQAGARKYPEPPMPAQHMAKPEEIAPAYVFLASPQTSSYITGEIPPIIGGY